MFLITQNIWFQTPTWTVLSICLFILVSKLRDRLVNVALPGSVEVAFNYHDKSIYTKGIPV